jgi:hypothetical protein
MHKKILKVMKDKNIILNNRQNFLKKNGKRSGTDGMIFAEKFGEKNGVLDSKLNYAKF